MAVPSGKRIGTTSIRVIPDATKFRNDLKLLLKRVENSMSANLQVTADTDKFEVDVRKLVKKWNGENVDLNINANTKGAAAHLKEFSRPRRVSILVNVSKASLAKAGTVLASLSGGRLIGDIVTKVSNTLQNLDRSLPKLTAIALGVASIGAAGLNAVHGIGAVGVQLTQLLPLAALLPGFFIGAGVSLTALVLAAKDAPKVLGSAATAYKSLGAIVSTNFWGEAAKPIRSLLTTLLPQVKTGFAGLSKSLGASLVGVASTFKDTLSGGVLGSFFDNITGGVTAATPGINAFAASFVSLIGFGTQYLPIFGGWVSQIGAQFSDWLVGVEASGQLADGITTGITLLHSLFNIAGSVGSILTGIFNAGGGQNPIGGLATGLAAVAAVINTAGFQTALGTIFNGAAAGAKGLSAALPAIGGFFGALAPTLATILSSSGQVVGKVLGGIAKALSQPAFQTGLGDFFAGIQNGLLAILPSLPALASALGSLGTFAGLLANAIGPVLGTALTALAPIFTQLLEGIEPILPVLGSALITAIQQIAPMLPGLVAALVPLLPSLADLIVSLLPMLVADVQLLIPVIDFLAAAINPLIQFLAWLMGLGDGPANFFIQLASGVSPLTLVMDGLKGKFGPIVEGILAFGTAIGKSIRSSVIGFITNVNLMIGAINGFLDNLRIMADALKTLTGGAINIKIGKIAQIPVPKAATGMTVAPRAGGTLVDVAEAGRAESIVDTGNVNALISMILSKGTGGAPGAPQVEVKQYFTPMPAEDARITARNAGREFGLAIAGAI